MRSHDHIHLVCEFIAAHLRAAATVSVRRPAGAAGPRPRQPIVVGSATAAAVAAAAGCRWGSSGGSARPAIAMAAAWLMMPPSLIEAVRSTATGLL